MGYLFHRDLARVQVLLFRAGGAKVAGDGRSALDGGCLLWGDCEEVLEREYGSVDVLKEEVVALLGR